MTSSQPAAAAAGYHEDKEEEEATNKNHHPEGRRITLIDTPPTASDELLTELKRHLPFSIPVLRRIQFANKFPGPPGSTEFAHVLWAFYEDEQKHFAAAYVDLSRGPETQCWIYCTLEDSFADYYYETTTAPFSAAQHGLLQKLSSEKEQSQADELVLTILRRMWEISSSQQQRPDGKLGEGLDYYNGGAAKQQHTAVLIGSLHETIRKRLLKLGVKMFKTKNVPAELDWEFCNKWLFRVEDFPPVPVMTTIPGGAGGDSNNEILSLPWTTNPDETFKDSKTSETVQLKLKFDKVKRNDIPLIRARTSIDRKPETLLRLPSLVLRRLSSSSSPSNNNSSEKEVEEQEEEAVAWAFTGLDGTLMTLHVEPSYRGLGLAKLIACRIMTDSLPLYGDDGWGAADVFVANTQSQGVCKSIGGKAWWTLSWAVVDLDSVPGLPT
ncbi:hypothetical protein V8F06_001469 [Rhypophila decipiens]